MDMRVFPAFDAVARPPSTTGHLLVILLALGLLGGCSPFSSDPKPLPDSTFTHLLMELHLAKARRYVDAPSPRGLRDSIFARYGVQPAAFDTTLKYYSRRPEAFKALYQPIIDTLEALQRARPSSPAPGIPDSISRKKGRYPPKP